MKLRLKTTFLALAILQLSLAQQINGTWNGKLNVQGQEIPLVFHFVENKKKLKAPWIALLKVLREFLLRNHIQKE